MIDQETSQLVVLAKAGDAAAEEQLLSRYRERLKRMIRVFLDPRVVPRVDPSDILQECLTCAAMRLPHYSEERTLGFYPWLRQIAKDRIVDAHRKHIRATKRSVVREVAEGGYFSDASVSHLADQLVSPETSPSGRFMSGERREILMKALHQLPEADREILLMKYAEQLSTSEIAEATALSESAVRSRLWRAIEKLSSLVRSTDP